MMPTLLRRNGVAVPSGVQGKDLFAGRRSACSPRRTTRATCCARCACERGASELKVIEANPSNPRGLQPYELYRMDQDPREQVNMAREDEETLGVAVTNLGTRAKRAQEGKVARQAAQRERRSRGRPEAESARLRRRRRHEGRQQVAADPSSSPHSRLTQWALPSGAHSFFQIGTRALICSIASRQAAKASARCGALRAPTITARSPTASWPLRCTAARRTPGVPRGDRGRARGRSRARRVRVRFVVEARDRLAVGVIAHGADEQRDAADGGRLQCGEHLVDRQRRLADRAQPRTRAPLPPATGGSTATSSPSAIGASRSTSSPLTATRMRATNGASRAWRCASSSSSPRASVLGPSQRDALAVAAAQLARGGEILDIDLGGHGTSGEGALRLRGLCHGAVS